MRVASVVPGDQAQRVNVQSTLKLAFNGASDSTSVTRANVRLLSLGVPVATKLGYDDSTRTVSIDPMGMTYGRSYTLLVSGLKAADGTPVPPLQSSFSTWVNALEATRGFSAKASK